MHAVTMSDAGGPEVLRWAEVPDLTVGPGEVLIDVAAAGVNRADLLQRLGRYDPPLGASPLLGLECAGTVSAVGDGVTDIVIGQHVCALLAGGGYAEQVAAPVGQVLPVPEGISLIDAAGLPEVICTVWSNLAMTAHLTAGQFLLIHGGGSGIGTAAIQIASALGARIAVTASSSDTLSTCAELGAETTINYAEEDFTERVLTATEGRGADVILDIVGGDYLERNIKTLADGGRLVIIGLLGGTTAELNIPALMSRRAGIIGTQLRSRPATGTGSKAEVVTAVRDYVWPMLHTGELRPVTGATVPMERAGEAHRMMHDGSVTGKIVLTRPESSV